jgi:FkbM family methyltransferase
MFEQASLRVAVADMLARASMKYAPFERALSRGIRNNFLCRRLHLGAIAHGYPRILGGPEIRIADFGSYRFYVNVAEPLGVQSYFFGDTCTLWFTKQLVRPGDSCIDAGANAGHYTFALASVVGRSGRVVAVEANPAMASLIERSARLNDIENVVSIERRALWSTSRETMRFLLSTNSSNTGTSSLVNHGVYVSPDTAVEVTTVTLDDLAREHRIDRVRLLKLDVERAEHQVLQGAEQLLSAGRIDYLIVEMHAGSPAQAVLESHGYVGRFIDAGRQQMRSLSPLPRNQFGDFLYASPSVSRASSVDLQDAFTGA